MTPITPQCEVFWALLSSSEHSGVLADSKPRTFPSVGLHPHTWPKWGCDIHVDIEKHNYDKHIEQMENSKDIPMEETWAFKVRLVPLFLMGSETPMPNVVLEFFNTLLIKGTNIYFEHKDKVYVISKQLIVDVFGVCMKGYVEN